MAIDEMDGALVVARWIPAGRAGVAEGGAWGWCLAKDWGPARMGGPEWQKAKARCAERAPTYHLAAIEDAMSSMLERVCEAGLRRAMPILSAELRASGSRQERRVEALCCYRAGAVDQNLALAAVAVFFEGLPHGCEPWTPGEPHPENSDRLRARLGSIRLAWQERELLGSETELGAAEKSKRI